MASARDDDYLSKADDGGQDERERGLRCNDDDDNENGASARRPTSTTVPPRRRRIVRRRGGGGASSSSSMPPHIASNPALDLAITDSGLPADYDFEIRKTLWRIETLSARRIALQMPEGLLLYGCALADLFKRFGGGPGVESVSILGDVTYGACCVDDLSAKALGCDLLVHYGHSCLVPMQRTAVPCLYVFVEIRIDARHLVDCFCETCGEGTEVFVMGTVQFRSAVVEAARLLKERNRPASVPQAKPLSPGEVLGCTAPSGLAEADADFGVASSSSADNSRTKERVMLFISDGRFHLEAAMIANPTLRALRYDPYSKTLTDEKYETATMKKIRCDAILRARQPSVKTFGVVLGTLGRQGNPAVLARVRSLLRKHGKRSFVLLLSEIFPAKLDLFPQVDAWVQIACPRLSVDWGHFFRKPVLTPYELHVCLGEAVGFGAEGIDGGDGDSRGKSDGAYPMDYYRSGSGKWTNYHGENRDRRLVAS